MWLKKIPCLLQNPCDAAAVFLQANAGHACIKQSLQSYEEISQPFGRPINVLSRGTRQLFLVPIKASIPCRAYKCRTEMMEAIGHAYDLQKLSHLKERNCSSMSMKRFMTKLWNWHRFVNEAFLEHEDFMVPVYLEITSHCL